MASPEPLPTGVDVVVVGAGPTGLLLAGDLAEGGARVLLLEKRDQESNLIRAFAVHARSLEVLDARGLAEGLVAGGHPMGTVSVFGQVPTSFADLPTRYPFLLVTPQYEVEKVLADRAARAGVTMVRGAEFVGVQSSSSEVVVTCRLDGHEQTVTAGWVVGCDGSRSSVRRLLQLPFPGRSVIRSLTLADVRLGRPPQQRVAIQGNAQGFCVLVPFGDGWHRVIGRDPRAQHRSLDEPVAMTEVDEFVQRVTGVDHKLLEMRWSTRFGSDERIVPEYRRGRVLLAGDAAHVHSPAGGLGMNTGLQDAANLGWKLAAVIAGRSPASLLDSYQSERRPIARQAILVSGVLARVAMARSAAVRWPRNLAVAIGLRVAPISRGVRMGVTGLGIRYRAPRTAGRWAGRRCPDLIADNGQRLAEAQRGGRFVVVVPSEMAGRVTEAVGERCTVVVPRRAVPMLLVRPDGYVAVSTDDEHDLVSAMADFGLLVPW